MTLIHYQKHEHTACYENGLSTPSQMLDDASCAHYEPKSDIQQLVQENKYLRERLAEQTKVQVITEEHLHRSQQLLQLVLDNIPQRIFWKDRELRYLGCNKSFAEHAGLKEPAQIIGMDDSQLPWKRDADSYRAADRSVMEKNESRLKFDAVQPMPDGRLLWQKKSKLPLYDKNGAVIGVLGTFEDITENVRIKDSLFKNEHILAEAQSIARLGSWEYCLETKKEYRSAEFFRILGYAEHASGFAHDSMFDYIHPQDREVVRHRITETLEHGKPYDVEYRIIRIDGRERFVHAKGKTYKEENQKTTSFIGTIQDITEQKQIKDALWLTQFSVDRAAIPILWIKGSGQLMYFNNACGFLGYPPEEMCSMTIFDIDPEISVEQWSQRCRESREKEGTTFQTRHKTKEGAHIPIELTINYLKHNQEEYYLIFAQNITERKEAEERNRKQVKRLASLRTIDMAISQSLDLRVSLNIVLDQAVHHLHADAADILLLNHIHTLEHAASRGFRSNDITHCSIPFGKGNAGRVAYERRLIHISDAKSFDNARYFPNLADEGFRGYLGAPLVVKGEVVGVLELYFRTLHELDQEMLDFFETLAGQTAIAFDNASLFSGLQRINIDLMTAYDSTLEGWSRALDLRDKETEGHSRRVTEMTERLARTMGIPNNELIHIRRGAMLHDIGKMGVPDQILLKPAPLKQEEREIMQQHPIHAHNLLSPIQFLRPALDIPYCHHEKWNGSGYPRGLKERQIPLGARIFAIVDVWDALRSDRPYRPAWSREKALQYIQQQSSLHFDPEVVSFFINYMEENDGTKG